MSRQQFLEKASILGLGLTVAGTSACTLFDDKEMLVCALEDLKSQDYVIARFNGKKILVTYLDDTLTIFSLICRHKKCTVAYHADEAQFICPCHEGTYDKYGEVIDGPPPGPLFRFKAEVREGNVWVVNEKVT